MFQTIGDLIERFSYWNSGKNTNWTLDNDVAMNQNDSRVEYSVNGNCRLVYRRYLVFDEDLRIINMQEYRNEILSCGYGYDRKRFCNRSYRQNKMNCVAFRGGPIPHISVKNRRGSYYRHPKTTQEKRMSQKEYKTFCRASRCNHLPSAYDDMFRSVPGSWKSNYKCKKQWMKHVR